NTRVLGWNCSSASGTNVRVASDVTWCPMPPRTIWACSALLVSSLHPGPRGPGGRNRMPAVNGVGEPCAGEPHARIEVAGAGNGAPLATATVVGHPDGKPPELEGYRAYSHAEPPRQLPTLRPDRLVVTRNGV